jgi:hypothetical protein
MNQEKCIGMDVQRSMTPSHIFAHLGDWDESAPTNERAWQVFS